MIVPFLLMTLCAVVVLLPSLSLLLVLVSIIRLIVTSVLVHPDAGAAVVGGVVDVCVCVGEKLCWCWYMVVVSMLFLR